MKKRILAMILSIIMVSGMFPMTVFAADVVASGYCGGEGNGSNLQWSLDSNGTLTIVGNGIMTDSYYAQGIPWDYQRDYIDSLIIDYGVKDIGDYLFYCCGNLSSVSISNSVNVIGTGAFHTCTSLSSIEIPNSVTTIGMRPFQNCTSLTHVSIPDSVTTLGSYAFIDCSGLTSVTLPETLSNWGDGIFYGCTSLTTINIPQSITCINESMFRGCKSLSSIIIPQNVDTIEKSAFRGCHDGINVYFEGNAPLLVEDRSIVGGTNTRFPFDDAAVLYYKQGTSGWTDSEAYDATAGTWNGYKLEVWGDSSSDKEDDSSDEDDNITYTRFGQYNGSTQNYVINPSTGFGKYVMETVTIDGNTYNFADTCEQQAIYTPTNYLGDFYYIAYNLNEHNEVSAAEIMSGITCTLEGYDPITKVVDTDYTPIIPVGEDRTLPSGSFYVSDVTASSFPSDQIGSWVGDRVRIYTVGEEIYKIVHITNGYGQLTRTDLTASPMIAEIDGVDYPVVAGDAGLAETIRAFPPGSQVSYTLYDGVIVEMASAEIPTLRVSINNPGNTYYVGEYICVLASDCLDTPTGTVRSMPINPVVSVSDESILSLENTITSLPDIFSILGLGKGIGLEDDTFVCYTFRANAPGNVAIHIGDDSTNGRQLTIPIAISVDPHAGMRADDVEIYEWDLLGSEDYYNEIVNGMVISDFNCTRRDDGDSEYRFNVYNRSTLLGVAEVYDAAGNLIDIRIIDKASMPTDLKSTLAETWNGLIKPIFTDQDLFSFRGSGSKRTDFTSNPILVPEGGHVKITNSMAISVPCLLLNSMDITLEGIGFLKGTVDAAEFTSASAKQTLLRQVLKAYLTPEGQQDILSQIAKSSLSSAGQAGIVAMFTDISGFAAEICDIVLASSHNTVVNTTIGMVQNTLESSGYGSALQVAFAATGIGNLIIQINQFSDSLSSDRAMTVYTPNDRQATVLAASHSVQLQAASVMEADTVLCADMIAASDWSKPHTADSQSCLCYDLSLQTAGCEISLPSASTVTFPLPSGTWEDLRLYYLNPDTKRWEELSYTIEGAQIMAEVNSLGQFALVDGALLDDLPPDTRKYTIKFDANGGYCATKSIELKSAGTLPYFPTAYRSGNWKFVGWYNKPSGGLPYTEDTIFAANPTLYAHWMKTDSPEASNLHISTSIYADEKVGAQITNRTEAPLNGIFVAAVYDESGKMLGIKYTENVLQSQKTLVLTIDAVNTDTIYMLRVFVMDPQSYQPIYPTWETKFPDDEKLV